MEPAGLRVGLLVRGGVRARSEGLQEVDSLWVQLAKGLLQIDADGCRPNGITRIV